MSYPQVTDNNFYEKINNKFKQFKIPKYNKSYDDWCFPKRYTLQLPQVFLSHFIHPNSPYTGVLVYHKVGSGKTATSIQIAEKWKKYKRIVVVLPASLRNNFRNELRSQCTGETYLKDKERIELTKLDPLNKRYIEIINKSDERINEYYNIYSYNKFIDLIENDRLNLRNTLLIIDEIQNMVSEHGTFYWSLYNAVKNAPKDLRIVLLSATPLFDRPSELALTLNLLRLPKEIPTGKEFNKMFIKTTKKEDKIVHNVKNMDLFKSYIKGFISYYQGAPEMTFPKTNIRYIRCEMQDFQYNVYKSISQYEEMYENEMTNDFYIGSRMISNIVFPNKLLNEKGFDMLTPQLIRKNLNKYSCKFTVIMEKIQRHSGKIFVYSNFKEYGGLASFIKVLEAYGYKNYAKHGIGKLRYGLWTGDENDMQKNEIRTIFNHKSNITGKNVKILLGSSAIKEGVTLLNVRQAHIIDGYWNWNKIKQIIGRVSRFCSHKDLPEEKRTVTIYMYLAVSKNENVKTVDEYMNDLAHDKDRLISKFEKAIKESAIDCSLNKNANENYPGEIQCDK
jgi:superfamily II DNA or RNA helicase